MWVGFDCDLVLLVVVFVLGLLVDGLFGFIVDLFVLMRLVWFV